MQTSRYVGFNPSLGFQQKICCQIPPLKMVANVLNSVHPYRLQTWVMLQNDNVKRDVFEKKKQLPCDFEDSGVLLKRSSFRNGKIRLIPRRPNQSLPHGRESDMVPGATVESMRRVRPRYHLSKPWEGVSPRFRPKNSPCCVFYFGGVGFAKTLKKGWGT